MLLREFTLGGTKAFGSAQSLKLDDINLLFGGNSSGKTTIMQSILLLQQSLERLAGPTERVLEFRGSRADLGGYRTFVHGHDITTPLVFGMTLTSEARLDRGGRFFPRERDISISLEFGLDENPEGEAKLRKVSISDQMQTFRFAETESGDFRIADMATSRAIVDRFFETVASEGGARLKGIQEPSDADKKWLATWLRKQSMSRSGWLPTWSPASLFVRPGRPVGGSKGNPRNTMAETIVGWWWNDTHRLFLSVSRLLDRLVHVGPLRDMPKRVTLEAMDTRGIGSRGEHLTQHLARNPQILHEVNVALEKLEIPYVLDLARFQDDDIVDAVGDLGVAVLREVGTGLTLSLADVGFGVSQVLPVVVHLLTSRRQVILIEQPEIHLHPRLQARMADIIIDSALRRRNQIIIESHSEHLLLRIERRLRERSDDLHLGQAGDLGLSVFYVARSGDGSEVLELDVDERGQVVSPWPDGFFDESFDDVIAGIR